MGSIEAYLGAFFFLCLVLCFALRMGVILELCFSWLSLFAELPALFTQNWVAVSTDCCLGPSELLFGHVVAAGGLWKCCFSGFAHVIAVRLVLSYRQGTLSRRRRMWLYGVWGLLRG